MTNTRSPFTRSNLLGNEWSGHCFACSPDNPHGLHMQFFPTESGITSTLTISDDYCGFEGIVHGGIIATLLDEVCAWAISIHYQQFAVTQRATIEYKKPVPTQTPLSVTGKITNQDDSQITTYASIQDPEGYILAEGTSSWRLATPTLLAKLTGKKKEEIQAMIDKLTSRKQ